MHPSVSQCCLHSLSAGQLWMGWNWAFHVECPPLMVCAAVVCFAREKRVVFGSQRGRRSARKCKYTRACACTSVSASVFACVFVCASARDGACVLFVCLCCLHVYVHVRVYVYAHMVVILRRICICMFTWMWMFMCMCTLHVIVNVNVHVHMHVCVSADVCACVFRTRIVLAARVANI